MTKTIKKSFTYHEKRKQYVAGQNKYLKELENKRNCTKIPKSIILKTKCITLYVKTFKIFFAIYFLTSLAYQILALHISDNI